MRGNAPQTPAPRTRRCFATLLGLWSLCTLGGGCEQASAPLHAEPAGPPSRDATTADGANDAATDSAVGSPGPIASADANAASDAGPAGRDATVDAPAMPSDAEAGCAPCPIQLERVEIGELTFDVRVSGPENGEPVMLLHGFPQMWLEWAAQIDALTAAGYRVAAPNQRGYSDAARPAEVSAYAADVLAQDVFDIADALGFGTFHLVGHDWGGVIAWHAAGLGPTRLASLTSVSVAHPDEMAKQLMDLSSCRYTSSSYVDVFASPLGESSLLAANAAGMRAIFGDLPTADEYIQFFTEDEARMTGGLNWYRANFVDRQYTAPLVGDISTPTLFLFGEFETECDQMPENTADYVTGPFRLEIIAGSDHWIPERAPEQVNPLLLAHLAAHPAY